MRPSIGWWPLCLASGKRSFETRSSCGQTDAILDAILLFVMYDSYTFLPPLLYLPLMTPSRPCKTIRSNKQFRRLKSEHYEGEGMADHFTREHVARCKRSPALIFPSRLQTAVSPCTAQSAPPPQQPRYDAIDLLLPLSSF
jgi:hypothetical protein